MPGLSANPAIDRRAWSSVRCVVRAAYGLVLPGGNMWKVAAAFALSVGFLFAAAGQASAASPEIGTFPLSETFVDEGASAACGFPVTATITGTGRFQVFFDQSGNPVRVQVKENTSGTFSANGLSVSQTSHTLSIINLVTGTETDIGIIIHVSLPGGGTLYLDRGRLVVDANGNVVFEAGPHPSLHGDFPGLCAALTP